MSGTGQWTLTDALVCGLHSAHAVIPHLGSRCDMLYTDTHQHRSDLIGWVDLDWIAIRSDQYQYSAATLSSACDTLAAIVSESISSFSAQHSSHFGQLSSVVLSVYLMVCSRMAWMQKYHTDADARHNHATLRQTFILHHWRALCKLTPSPPPLFPMSFLTACFCAL